MLVYRNNPKTGFKETINTVGNYKPKGWKAVNPKKRYEKKDGYRSCV